VRVSVTASVATTPAARAATTAAKEKRILAWNVGFVRGMFLKKIKGEESGKTGELI
jgi:hypothetical protein